MVPPLCYTVVTDGHGIEAAPGQIRVKALGVALRTVMAARLSGIIAVMAGFAVVSDQVSPIGAVLTIAEA